MIDVSDSEGRLAALMKTLSDAAIAGGYSREEMLAAICYFHAAALQDEKLRDSARRIDDEIQFGAAVLRALNTLRDAGGLPQ